MLKIYKASAGSGKTFTLTVEYIKLLIQNPSEYRHILAVTFTNKATAEMKSRILSTLYGIAHSLSAAENYLDKISNSKEIEALHLSTEQIRERASVALGMIIHDYSRFHIETIDSFFQSIIRELANELGLTANLKVDLNDKDVLAEAITEIIDNIENNREIYDYVIRFVEEKINNGSNWHIEQEMNEFGKNIFNEHFLIDGNELRKRIAEPNFIKEYRKTLYALRKNYIDRLSERGKTFIQTQSERGYSPNDFKQGQRGVWGFYAKLASGTLPEKSNKYVENAATDANEWCKKSGRLLSEDLEGEYIPYLMETISLFTEATVAVNSIDLITKHLHHLQLLNTINEYVRSLNKEANRFLLADTAYFLREMIDGNDIPFIYEKTGTRYNHIMIDEFQDTSELQYDNFRPLLDNCLSLENGTALIVGDVKQSIYRFRNSDWKILNSRIDADYVGQLKVKHLENNFRSAGNIIDFNNKLFTSATSAIINEHKDIDAKSCEELKKAYSDVCQNVPEKSQGTGFVRIAHLSAETNAEYKEQTLQHLLETVIELTENGVNQNDITILIRFNKSIPVISEYFAKHGGFFQIVSDDAFRLDSSSAINLLVCALRYLSKPDDRFCKATLAYYYNKMRYDASGNKELDTNEAEIKHIFLYSDEQLSSMLPPELTSNIDSLSFTPIHELTEQLYNILDIENIPEQEAYLFAFNDSMTEFIEEGKTDLESFLTYWEEHLHEKTIPNGNSDGIRITTIHKSKGLEFHTVIIPFCDWSTIGGKSDMIWCHPKYKPYNRLNLTPIVYQSNAIQSIFIDEYYEETLRRNVDNLNLIYVAFTRAEKNLIIFTGGQEPSGNKTDGNGKKRSSSKKIIDSDDLNNSDIQKDIKSNGIKTVTDLLLKSMPDFMNRRSITEGNTLYEYGDGIVCSESKKDKQKEDEEKNILARTYSPIKANYTHYASIAEFRQSNNSALFIAEEDPKVFERKMEYINKGLIYHEILSMLHTASDDDIEQAVAVVEQNGCFDAGFTSDEAIANLKSAFTNKTALSWFSKEWRVFNECNIVKSDAQGNTYEQRPDRVIMKDDETIVIDFKSGIPKPIHKDQINTYMDLLVEMGYPNVHGYLWYIMENRIVECKHS